MLKKYIDTQFIIQQYQNGLSLRQIARILNTTRSLVKYRLNKNNIKIRKYNIKKIGKFIKCKKCGIDFYIMPSEEKRGKKYCSVKCYLCCKTTWNKGLTKETDERIKKMAENQIGKIVSQKTIKKLKDNHPNFKGKNHPQYGTHRSEETKEKLKQANLGKKMSEETKNKIKEHHIKNNINKGEKNHFWKGGITPIRPKIHQSWIYRQWRINIFQRDNYTCQECKKRGGVLHTHHSIIPFSKIINAIKQWCDEFSLDLYETAIQWQPLWNVDNGITICKDCHKEFHRIYGKKDNNQEQLNEFLNRGCN